MTHALRRWVELWNRREPPTVLALVRILVGAVLLADLLQVAAHGVVEALWAPPAAGGMGIGAVADAHGPWVVRWLGASTHTAWTLWTAATLAAAALMLGAFTRVAAIVFVLLSAQMAVIAPDSDRGIDILMRAVVGVLAFSHSHAIWSVDALIWRKLGRPPPALIPSWPRYLLFAQMVWLYFSAGTAKTQAEWGPAGGFSALGSILADPHFSAFDPGWLRYGYPLTVLATAATVTFEWGAPGFLLATWFDATRERGGRLRKLSNKLRLRWLWIATGVSFHLGIALTMRLGIFPWGTLAVYPVFVHPDELARAATWVRAAARRRAARAAPRSSSDRP